MLFVENKPYQVIGTFVNIRIAKSAVLFVKNYPGKVCQAFTCCMCL